MTRDPIQMRSGLEVVTFRSHEQDFCLDILSVREIRGWTQATAIPHAPPYVIGVINLRGAVLPIVDLAAKLGLPKTKPTSRHVIIVTQLQKKLFGLLVDGVSDILAIPEDAIQPTPDIAADMTQSFVRSVIMMEGRMLGLISLDEILPSIYKEAA